MSAEREDYEARAQRERSQMMLEAYAAAAMIGFLCGAQLSGRTITPEAVAEKSYAYGKALLAKLEFERPK